METPYGPIKKTPWLILIFAVPGIVMFGGVWALTAESTGSYATALNAGGTLLVALLALILVIWGVVFTRRPVAIITETGLMGVNDPIIGWADVTKVDTGVDVTAFPSQSTGARKVQHEVIRLRRKDGEAVKLVLTWAAEGHIAAAERIQKAFELSR